LFQNHRELMISFRRGVIREVLSWLDLLSNYLSLDWGTCGYSKNSGRTTFQPQDTACRYRSLITRASVHGSRIECKTLSLHKSSSKCSKDFVSGNSRSRRSHTFFGATIQSAGDAEGATIDRTGFEIVYNLM